MEAYVAGDPGAFRRLFRLLAPSMHAFFARSAGHGAADDLLQTTFLKLHASRASWRPGERLRPWAFTIAARVRIDWLRRQGRRADHEQADGELEGDGLPDPSPSADPGEVALGKERDERVRAALERVPEPQRVVVHLHRFEGMGFAEIGKVLGISEVSARVRAFRAYARLRELLADLVTEGTT